MEEVVLVFGLLLKYGPGLARDVSALFQKSTPPTPEEIEAVLSKAEKTKESYFYIKT